MLKTTSDTTMPGRDTPDTSRATSSSSNESSAAGITVAPAPQSPSRRKRKQTRFINADMRAASKSSYVFKTSDESAAILESAFKTNSTYTSEAAASSASQLGVRRLMDTLDIAEIAGAITSGNVESLRSLVKNVDLNNFQEHTLAQGRKKHNSWISYAIALFKYDTLAILVDNEVNATLDDLESIIKKHFDGDAIELVVKSLAKQKIKIPVQIIEDLRKRGTIPGYNKEKYVPELCQEFEAHNAYIDSLSAAVSPSNPGEGTALALDATISSSSNAAAPAELAATKNSSPKPFTIKPGDYINIHCKTEGTNKTCRIILNSDQKNSIRVLFDDNTWAWKDLDKITISLISSQAPAQDMVFQDPESGLKYRLFASDGILRQIATRSAPHTAQSSDSPTPKIGNYIYLMQKNMRGIVICFNASNKHVKILYDNGTWAWELLKDLQYKVLPLSLSKNETYIDPENSTEYRHYAVDGSLVAVGIVKPVSSSSSTPTTGLPPKGIDIKVNGRICTTVAYNIHRDLIRVVFENDEWQWLTVANLEYTVADDRPIANSRSVKDPEYNMSYTIATDRSVSSSISIKRKLHKSAATTTTSSSSADADFSAPETTTTTSKPATVSSSSAAAPVAQDVQLVEINKLPTIAELMARKEKIKESHKSINDSFAKEQEKLNACMQSAIHLTSAIKSYMILTVASTVHKKSVSDRIADYSKSCNSSLSLQDFLIKECPDLNNALRISSEKVNLNIGEVFSNVSMFFGTISSNTQFSAFNLAEYKSTQSTPNASDAKRARVSTLDSKSLNDEEEIDKFIAELHEMHRSQIKESVIAYTKNCDDIINLSKEIFKLIAVIKNEMTEFEVARQAFWNSIQKLFGCDSTSQIEVLKNKLPLIANTFTESDVRNGTIHFELARQIHNLLSYIKYPSQQQVTPKAAATTSTTSPVVFPVPFTPTYTSSSSAAAAGSTQSTNNGPQPTSKFMPYGPNRPS